MHTVVEVNVLAVITVLVFAAAVSVPEQREAVPIVAPPPLADRKGEAEYPVAINDEATWVTTDDYPLTALRDERFGVTATALTVGPDGRVSHCRVVTSSGSVDLDETACRSLTERARFRPARDARGRPVEATYFKRVRWQLPDLMPIIEPVPSFTSAGGVVARLHVNQEGIVDSCFVIPAANSSSPQAHPNQEEICSQLRGQFAEEPVRSSWAQGTWIEMRQLSYSYRSDPGWVEPGPPVAVPAASDDGS